MALSPNYGWAEPDNSSLVKNGAQDIRALGDAIDAFLFRPFTRNAIINGAMDIWQRGTSISMAASAPVTYLSDRWCGTTGANQATTVTRQATGDTTNLPDIQYALRWQRDSGQTGTTGNYLSTSLETVNSVPFAGQTITFSFYARKGANYSPTSNALSFGVYYGTGTDQNFQSTYTGITAVTTGTATLTSTWQRFTATAAVSGTATELAAFFLVNPTGTAGAADYFEVTGVQLEVGSQASPFARTGATIQGELAACQRYYYRATFDEATARLGVGYVDTATAVLICVPFPVQMRTRPTALEQSGTAGDYSVAHPGAATICSAVPIFNYGSTIQATTQLTVASGVTVGRGAFLRAVNTNAFLGWSAEL
jgi:hypothetical protein